MRIIAALTAVACLLPLAIGSGAADGRGAQASGSATVGIKHFKYQPTALVIRKGTKVVFANHDRVAHTATRRGSFSTGRIRPGHAVAVRFTRRGKYGFF